MVTTLVVVLGVYLRYIALQETVILAPVRADAADYYQYADNLVDWHVYSKTAAGGVAPEPDALRSPGFPFFASLFMAEDIGRSLDNVLLAQTCLQIAIFILFSTLIVRELGNALSIFPIVFLWTFPHFVSINTYFLSESVFASCLALFICTALLSTRINRQATVLWACMGAVLAAASLVRPTLQYFPFFLLLILSVKARKVRKEYLIMAGGAVIPLIGWGMRNLFAIGAWSDPTLMINGLYHGSFPMFMYNDNPLSFGFPYRYDPMADQVYEGVGTTLKIIADRAIAEPDVYIRWYLAGKQFFLWQWDIIAGQGDVFVYHALESPYYNNRLAIVTHDLNKLIHPYLMSLSFIGMGVMIRKFFSATASLSYFWLFVGGLFLYAILIHVIVAPFPRYGIPFKVAAVLMAIYVVQECGKWIRQKKSA